MKRVCSISLFILSSPQLCTSFLAAPCGAPLLLLDMSSSSSLPHVQHPWQQSVSIDYSAANEYTGAHYRHLYPEDEPYFGTGGKEDIFSARQGYIIDEGAAGIGTTGTRLVQPSLERCGFELIKLEEDGNNSTDGAVSDWTDMDQVTSKYLPKLRQAILRAFQDDGNNNESNGGPAISHILFYQPMLRGEAVEMGTKTSPVASLVHIDTDIGAHDAGGIVSLVERNQIISAKSDDDSDDTIFPGKEMIDIINKGSRFAIVNAWRGVSPDRAPVGRAHLGLFSPRYHDPEQSLPRRHQCYPALRPKRPQSRWYAYPQMEHDEVLLFKQYDRRVDRVSDLWHCSLPVFPV